MSTVLEKDSKIQFPHFMVLKASAGSGKTYALTERYVQFILSDNIPRNSLRNILAITFSNNAAKEMKDRVLSWLKSLHFEDNETVDEIQTIVTGDREIIIASAEQLIDEILDNYSDFQVKTIDSFMTTIFKASAIDFGYNPEFDILMSNDRLIEYSFNVYLKSVRESSTESRLIEDIIRKILSNKKGEAAFLWDPSKTILQEIKKIYSRLSATGKKPFIDDHASELSGIRKKMKATAGSIEKAIEKSALGRRSNSSYASILSFIKKERFSDIIGRGLANPPVKKPTKKDPLSEKSFEHIIKLWEELGQLISQYAFFHALSYYTPYLRVHEAFSEIVERTKKNQGKIFIEDISRYLSEYLNSAIVPDVYFRLGETILHFFIDEFQDTSPIQWKNLLPLIDNSLSQGGSIFVVGDSKQAIYGFRNADYTIMKRSETANPFPSAHHKVLELDRNYRSRQKVLDFSKTVFREIIKENADYKKDASKSGLTDWSQKSAADGDGYAEVTIFDKNEENLPERLRIQELMEELHTRGYSYGDIAVLTRTNEEAIQVTSWLNEKDIPFISFSNLDIRRRKITGEIVSLLTFLDSPPDDLSFATFVLGELFQGNLQENQTGITQETLRDFLFSSRNISPLYKSFQVRFPELWDTYFARLFASSGYLPLYDLVTEIFSIFRVFKTAQEEEAALVKILDVINNFEGEGYNNIRDFLSFAGESENADTEWNMNVPKSIDAVKVMTIHKAKGLGFPVVIIVLYEESGRRFDHIAVEENESIRLLKITQAIISNRPELGEHYQNEQSKERVNSLNTLYVGFTRAAHELYVIGVNAKSGRYPLDILPASTYPPADKPQPLTERVSRESALLPTRHYHQLLKFPISSPESMNIPEKQRGEFIHKVLSCIQYVSDGFEKKLLRIIKNVNQETGNAYPESIMVESLAKVLSHQDIEGYFLKKPGRIIKTETDITDRHGSLYRIDRLIIDKTRLTVIDYKTGKDMIHLKKHATQVKTYMRLLNDIYPDKVIDGILLYVDTGEIRRIS